MKKKSFFDSSFKDVFARTIFVRPLYLIFLIIIAIYSRGLDGSFVLDDRTYFIDNDILPNLKPWEFFKIFFNVSNYWGEQLPVRDFFFVLQYSVFKYWTTGYHLVSIFLYLLIGLLCYSLSFYFFKKFAPSQEVLKTETRSLIVTALFMLHPSHVECVAYISGQKDLFFALFSLAATLLFLIFMKGKNPDIKHIIIFLGCYYLSFLSKNAAIGTTLLIPFLYIFLTKHTFIIKTKFLWLWGLANIPVYFWINHSIKSSEIFFAGTNSLIDFPFWFRIIRAFRILGAHAVHALVPWPLNFGYPFNHFVQWDFFSWFGVGVILIFLISIIWNRTSSFSLGIFIFLIYLAPALQIFNTMDNDVVYDRYLFLPILGLALIIEYIFIFLLKKVHISRLLIIPVFFILLIAMSILTWGHIPSFNSNLAQTRHAYLNYPDWRETPYKHVSTLIESGELDSAEEITRKEKSFYHPPWQRDFFLGWIYLERGQLSQAEPLLRHSTLQALTSRNYPKPILPLAKVLILQGKINSAKQMLKKLINHPLHHPIYYYRAKKMLQQLQERS